MELKDTVEGMLSTDYKERFKAEYQQLKIRFFSLWNMLASWSAGELDFEPTCPRDLLEYQASLMLSMLHTLEHRADIEGVDLNE